MRKLGTLAAVVALVALVSTVHPDCVYACSCRPPGSPAHALAEATAVFAGKVAAIRAPADQGGANPVEVAFTVTHSWKGALPSSLVVTTPASSASCGVEFVQGQEYLVYARESEGVLQVSLCSRTTQLALAGEDLAALGVGNPSGSSTGGTAISSTLPATGASSAPRRWSTAIAALVVLLGVAIRWRGCSHTAAPRCRGHA